MILDLSWEDHGACRGVDPDLFFPEKSGSSNGAVAQAKLICANCLVREQCLEFALAHHERYGVWGGMSDRDRERERRRRAILNNRRAS